MSPTPRQPITDDSIIVRQLSHYQFSRVAGDADNLQDLLSTAETVFYDVSRKTLMFGTTAVGHH